MLFSNHDFDSSRLNGLRTGAVSSLIVVIISVTICGFAFFLGLFATSFSRSTDPVSHEQSTREQIASPIGQKADPLASESSDGQPLTTDQNHPFKVLIRKPDGPPRVFTGIDDSHGNPVTVSCSTCHAGRQPNFENRKLADMDEFHGNLKLSHGSISCLSCHNSTDYDALKLADGTRIEFTDVMTLCAQCHGPQMRDYQHNAHGGFNGHWDLSRGNQIKNNCIDCHHPHSPQFPKMQPTFKPKDRFLDKPKDSGHQDIR